MSAAPRNGRKVMRRPEVASMRALCVVGPRKKTDDSGSRDARAPATRNVGVKWPVSGCATKRRSGVVIATLQVLVSEVHKQYLAVLSGGLHHSLPCGCRVAGRAGLPRATVSSDGI